MPDVGSDQNYLAVHISLSFALQRYFETVMAPVPGVLILDQISRPYFPTSGEDEDETEIAGGEEDEDVQATEQASPTFEAAIPILPQLLKAR